MTEQAPSFLFISSLNRRCCTGCIYKMQQVRCKQLYSDCKQDYTKELAGKIDTALAKHPFNECSG